MSRDKMYAKYTTTLYDALIDDPTLLDVFVMDTEEHTDTFKRIFTAYWNIHEIGGETISIFKRFLENKFIVSSPYYIEMINAYETKINMLDGAKSRNVRTLIDLPRKNVTANKEYPTTKEYIDTDGGINVIELKNEYLNHIRNLYEDFAKSFKECFILLYD